MLVMHESTTAGERDWSMSPYPRRHQPAKDPPGGVLALGIRRAGQGWEVFRPGDVLASDTKPGYATRVKPRRGDVVLHRCATEREAELWARQMLMANEEKAEAEKVTKRKSPLAPRTRW